jgi:hypothetical protein
MYQRTIYHNTETSEESKVCPQGPVFVEGSYLTTVIEVGMEVHVCTISFRPFRYE